MPLVAGHYSGREAAAALPPPAPCPLAAGLVFKLGMPAFPCVAAEVADVVTTVSEQPSIQQTR